MTRSSADYFVGANGQPLGGLTVTLTVTEDIVPLVSAAGRKPQNPAFTLQVNCYAGAPGPLGNSAWQQYVFTLSQDGAGGKLVALVENWPSPEFAKTFPSGTIKDGFIRFGLSHSARFSKQPETAGEVPTERDSGDRYGRPRDRRHLQCL